MNDATHGGARRLLADLGALRAALCTVIVALIVAAPFSGGQARFEGLAFVITVLAPAFFVMFVFILALDLAMTRVFLTDKSGEERARYVRVLWVEGGLLIALLAAWAPLVVDLLWQG